MHPKPSLASNVTSLPSEHTPRVECCPFPMTLPTLNPLAMPPKSPREAGLTFAENLPLFGPNNQSSTAGFLQHDTTGSRECKSEGCFQQRGGFSFPKSRE